MTDDDRQLLAERIRARRRVRFATKSAAYQAAGVNSATWDRIEQGKTVREDRLRAAVGALWPLTEGDWRRVENLESPLKPRLATRRPAPSKSTDPLDLISDWIQSLEDRLHEVEETVTELKEGPHHDAQQEPRTETSSQEYGGAGDGEGRPPSMTERVAAIEDEIGSLRGADSSRLIAQLRDTAAKHDRDQMVEGRGDLPQSGGTST